jgi:predicted HNH restriction endonuclease
MKCFEYGDEAEYQHHIVPKSLGGKKTIPLCSECHGKIHNKTFLHISNLTKQVLKRKISNSEYIGGECKFGYKLSSDKVHIEQDEYEQKIIAYIKQLSLQNKSCRQIAIILKQDGLVNKRNNKNFGKSQINRIINS